MFIDETGISERPHRVRTWAPRGHTPVLQMHFNWHQLSAIAGLTFWNFYFKIVPGSFNGPRVIDFLRQLRRQIKRRLLVIWDGLPAHRSRIVRDYVDSTKGAIQTTIGTAVQGADPQQVLDQIQAVATGQ